VLSAKIIRDAATYYSFGYGFVEYSRPEDAARAIDALKGYPVQNKRLGVTYSRVHNREDLKNTNLVTQHISRFA
jgi:RNA recognition motif-containing protein